MDAKTFAIHKNAIMGLPNTGKSYHSMVWAERLMDEGIPIVAIDPVGIWFGLKIGVNGNKGYPIVVAGGENADIPLSLDTIAPIMKAALAAKVSIVFDLYEPSSSKAHQKRLVAKLAECLLFNNRRYGLRHVFLEEAAEFCPQVLNAGDYEVYGMLDTLARTGRNYSLGMTFINQRAEQLNKSVLEICTFSFWHKQSGRNSLKAIADWMKIKDVPDWESIITKIPQLQQGECYEMGENEAPTLIKTPERKTYHPDPTQIEVNEEIVKKAVDVSAFVTELNKALAEAAKVDEEEEGGGKTKGSAAAVRQLRGEVADLQKEMKIWEERVNLTSQSNQTLAEENEKLAQQNERLKERYKKVVGAAIIFYRGAKLMKEEANKYMDIAENEKKKFSELGFELDELGDEFDELNFEEIIDTLPEKQQPNIMTPAETQAYVDRQLEKDNLPVLAEPATEGREKGAFTKLPKGEKLIVEFLSSYPDDKFTYTQIAIVTGYSEKSSGFVAALRAVVTKKVINKDGSGEGTLYSFRSEAKQYKNSKHAFKWSYETFIKRIPKGEREVITVLRKFHNRPLSFEAIAAQTASKYSVNSSGYIAVLRSLITKEILTKSKSSNSTVYYLHNNFTYLLKLFNQ